MSSPRTGRVAWITIAPVKALGLVSLDRVRLDTFGVASDRRFILVDSSGRLVNGKRAPSLSAIVPDYEAEADRLALRFADGSVISASVELEPRGVEISLFGRPTAAHVVRGPWAGALSAHAGLDVRLVRLDRPGDGVDRTGGGATILSVAALDDLARAARIAGRVDGRRFRMLLGVDGVPAHVEDGWIDRPVRVGEAVVVPRGNVGRCVVTTRHPDTGEPDLDTLRILLKYRGDLPTSEPLPFGVWASISVPGSVSVGDPVYVEEA